MFHSYVSLPEGSNRVYFVHENKARLRVQIMQNLRYPASLSGLQTFFFLSVVHRSLQQHSQQTTAIYLRKVILWVFRTKMCD